jgi:tetratricopeptide (TPR) repeat protein
VASALLWAAPIDRVPEAAAWSTATLVAIEPPPTLVPGLFDRSALPIASMPLAEVVASLPAEQKGVVGRRDGSIEAADADRALRRYVEGRAALLEGKALVAVQKLEEALRLDPSAPDVLAELARAYGRVGNGQKAAQLHRTLLEIDPTNAEARLSLGLQASNRGDAAATIRFLAPLVLATADERTAAFSNFRPDAENAVDLALARALRDRGADEAVVALASATLARVDADDGVPLDGRQRAELRTILGDALARRGRFDEAADVWSRAARELQVPVEGGDALVDDVPPALSIRVVWGDLVRGAPDAALAAVASMLDGDRARLGRPSDEAIATVRWLADALAERNDPAARDALAVMRRMAESIAAQLAAEPDDSIGDELVAEARTARALAGGGAPVVDLARWVAPIGADRRLMLDAFIDAHAAGGPDLVVARAAEFLALCPLDPEPVLDALLLAPVDAKRLRTAAQTRAGEDAVPVDGALFVRLLARLGQVGDAWATANARLATNPHPMIARARIAALGAGIAAHGAGIDVDVGLLDQAVAAVDLRDVANLLEAARAYRAVGEGARVRELVDRGMPLAAGDARLRSVLARLDAQAWADRAARRGDVEALREAIATTQAALRLDAGDERSWRLLLGLVDALGSGRQATNEDRARSAAARNEALAALPASTLAAQLVVERLFASGRGADALESLAARAAADPTEPDLLATVVRTLASVDRRDDALIVLEERLRRTPADAATWRLWAETLYADGRAAAVLERIEPRVAGAASERDPVVERLLEGTLRELGRHAEADAEAERILDRQPPSPRRELARAARAVAAERFDEAADLLVAIERSADRLQPRDAFTALEIAMRIGDAPADPGRRLRLAIAFGTPLLARATDEGLDPIIPLRAATLLLLESADAKPPVEVAVRNGWIARPIAAAIRGMRQGGEVFGERQQQAWQAAAQLLADAGRFVDASELLGGLVRSAEMLDVGIATRLATTVWALDARAGGRSASSMALLELLRARGGRPFARPDRPAEKEADALYQLAALAATVGDDEGSVAILRTALGLEPNHAKSLNNLGWGLLERGEWSDEIVDMIERAHRGMPDDGAILDSLGLVRYKQGRFDEAIDLFQRAIQAGGQNPGLEPFDQLGDALWRAGRRDEAIAAWRQVRVYGDREYPRDGMLRVLAQHQRTEYGVQVIDGPPWWQKHYGRILERAAAKLRAVEAGGEPEVKPLAPSAVPAGAP